jgi:hypothetical protein
MTDEQALQLIRTMRHDTQSANVAELLDWILARVAAPAATGAAPPGSRNEYYRRYMRDWRAKRKQRRAEQRPD